MGVLHRLLWLSGMPLRADQGLQICLSFQHPSRTRKSTTRCGLQRHHTWGVSSTGLLDLPAGFILPISSA